MRLFRFTARIISSSVTQKWAVFKSSAHHHVKNKIIIAFCCRTIQLGCHLTRDIGFFQNFVHQSLVSTSHIIEIIISLCEICETSTIYDMVKFSWKKFHLNYILNTESFKKHISIYFQYLGKFVNIFSFISGKSIGRMFAERMAIVHRNFWNCDPSESSRFFSREK